MSFYAKSFNYAGEVSELYNLQIASIDSGGTTTNPGSGGVEIIDQFVLRRPIPFFYGIKYTQKMSFPISFFSPDEISAVDLSYIQRWLFGRLNYQSLAIIEPDMDSFFMNCIFTEPTIIRAGNIIYGVQGVCTMDSQFAWTYPRQTIYNYTSPPSGSQIVINNDSHYTGYLYPEMTFRMSASGSALSIINTSDNNREFLFSGLSPNEVITINNDLGIVTSSLLIPRLSVFNKHFLRFAPGINILSVTGGISQMTLTYQFARRLGG